MRRVVDSVHEQLRKQFLLPRGLEKLSSSVGDLSEEDRAKIATLMFGPRGEEGATVRMKSLLNSMIEMGFPQAGKISQFSSGLRFRAILMRTSSHGGCRKSWWRRA